MMMLMRRRRRRSELFAIHLKKVSCSTPGIKCMMNMVIGGDDKDEDDADEHDLDDDDDDDDDDGIL